MLYLSDADRKYLRAHQDTWVGAKATRAAQAKVAPRKLNRDRYRHLIGIVAAVLAKGEPTKFSHEAACRHFIRSRLCLKGWAWSDADAVAADIVGAALRRMGAQRPTWKQGQPEFTQEGHSPIERTRCVRCGWMLPEGHTKFCSEICGNAYHSTLLRIREAEEQRAYELVAKGSKWLAGTCD